MPESDHLGQMQADTAEIREYLKIHITSKSTPSISDPVHLRQELLQIHKQLLARLSLPEDSHGNVWHHYRFLTISPVIHGGKLVLMIRILLIDWDSIMNIYKIYNLPIYNHNIGKSLQYVLQGTNLAITKDGHISICSIRHGIQSVYFGRWTFLCLEYWVLPC